MDSGPKPEADVRPIPSGDETWVAVVRQVASTVDSSAELEAKLRQRYPDAVVQASTLDGLARSVWYVYKRRWFERR